MAVLNLGRERAMKLAGTRVPVGDVGGDVVVDDNLVHSGAESSAAWRRLMVATRRSASPSGARSTLRGRSSNEKRQWADNNGLAPPLCPGLL